MNLTAAGIGIAGGRFNDIYWSLNSMTYIANNSQPIPRRFITKHQRERSPADENGILLPSLSLPAHTFSFLHHRFLRSRTPNHQQYSIGRHACIKRDLKPNDFDPREKFWSQFPSEGSNITPTHQSSDFWWKAYFPVVFRHLRELFQVDPADFMLAICGTDALRELSSPGKSGSSFHLTQDDKFMIKTVKKSEVKK